MPPSSAVMVGLASAGKTTFLAAFYHVIESGAVGGSLTLARMPPVREHLERIRREWLAVQPQTRTTANVLDQNILEVCTPDGETGSIYFPDLAGEMLAALVEERNCSRELANVFERADRILLFVHPDKVIESPTIAETAGLAALLSEEESADAGALEPTAPWELSMVSTQVRLVELLQIVSDLSAGLAKVGVVVSAWDRVMPMALSPKQWLARRLPLLSQFLENGLNEAEVAYFGVSAAGGDPQRERDNLAANLIPANRIVVANQDAETVTNDITLPVRWLLSI